jgi:F-type H+-transporting ATPase subunit gamma
MPTLEALKSRIESTQDLQSVVKTMKALAAVNIRQYEKAVAALKNYMKTVEMGLQIALRSRPGFHIAARNAPQGSLGAIVFGSDQGMCGQLNEHVALHALAVMDDMKIVDQNRRLITVGIRVRHRLDDEGQKIQNSYAVPNSVGGITSLVQNLLLEIEDWDVKDDVNHVFVFYCEQLSGAAYRPQQIHLLPIDHEWLQNLRGKDWPTNNLPTYAMRWDPLFSALIRQYIFGSLFHAAAESLASENASRLASMQGAERNIEDQLHVLNQEYHQQRQMSITEELLDIVSGFEALKSDW